MVIRKTLVFIVLLVMASVAVFAATEEKLFIKARKVSARELLKVVARFSNQNIVVAGPLAPVPVDVDQKEISASEAIQLVASQAGMVAFFRYGIWICSFPEILTDQNQMVFSGKIEGTKWISLDFLDADIRDIIRIVADHSDNKASSESKIRGNVSCRFEQVLPEPALRALTTACGYSCTVQDKTIFCEKKVIFKPRPRPLQNKSPEIAVSPDESALASSPVILQAIVTLGDKRCARFSRPDTVRGFLAPGGKLDEIYSIREILFDEVLMEDTRTGKKCRISFDKPLQSE
ncbi:MAG: hypothetical protein HQM09_06850 [Candidatus Riflebacteria bacterium]|nr:hypothetical protein [Candidatus Riflebacteria bacterium]